MNRDYTEEQLAEMRLDLRKLLDPSWGGSLNILYSDGIYARSIQEKWLLTTTEMAEICDYDNHKNTLVVIGCIGMRTAYLNVPMEEAIKRFLKANPEFADQINDNGFIDQFHFDDAFGVYSAGPIIE